MSLKRSISSLFGRTSRIKESNKPPSALGADGVVLRLLTLPDERILVCGIFQTLCGQKRVGIGRLNPDCILDAEFDLMVNNRFVTAVTVQHDGKILVGGGFTNILGQERRNIARLNPDGSLDGTLVTAN